MKVTNSKKILISTVLFVLITLPACNGRRRGQLLEAATRQRIISLSPGITEMLYGVGAFSSLVADSEFCDYPEEAKALPHVGGFFNVNLEAMAELKPDLVIIIDDQAPFFKDKLEQIGIRVLVVKIKSVSEVIESIRVIGRETDHQAEGDRLADMVQDRVDQRAGETNGLQHPKVMCVIDRIPGTLRDIYVANANSFLSDLITASGGQNVMPPNGNGYAKVQEEAIIDYNPDVIIDIIHKAGAAVPAEPEKIWRSLPQVSAVRTERVTFVSESYVVHPSQRLVDGLDTLSRIIHPEVFGKYEE